jgi:fructose-bisphosphate aldolase, class II
VLAEAAHRLAEKYDVLIALHTDHCQPKKVETFLRRCSKPRERRIAEGKGPLFQSHMLDASELPLEENLELSKTASRNVRRTRHHPRSRSRRRRRRGGRSRHLRRRRDKLYTTPEDMLAVYEALQPIGRFLFAATFGNVHGAYKPGAVKLKPTILRDGQAAVMDKHGADAEMDLVFHGGSGSELSEIRETLDYGVVKMNIDTDTQYAFTRPIVTHICQNIEGVLKIDGEVGDKKTYDPRSYLKKAEAVDPYVDGLGHAAMRHRRSGGIVVHALPRHAVLRQERGGNPEDSVRRDAPERRLPVIVVPARPHHGGEAEEPEAGPGPPALEAVRAAHAHESAARRDLPDEPVGRRQDLLGAHGLVAGVLFGAEPDLAAHGDLGHRREAGAREDGVLEVASGRLR